MLKALSDHFSEKIKRLSDVVGSGRLMGTLFKEIAEKPSKKKGDKKIKQRTYGFKHDIFAGIIRGKTNTSENLELDENELGQIIESTTQENSDTLANHNEELGNILKGKVLDEENARKLMEILESEPAKKNSTFSELSNVLELRRVLNEISASSKTDEEHYRKDTAVASDVEAVNYPPEVASNASELLGRNDVFSKQTKMRAFKY
jgi:hypothetical protein